MKKRTLWLTYVLIACMCFSHELAAQEITITGKLLSSDGSPVGQANIRLLMAGIETQSNTDGSFTLYQDNTGIEDLNPENKKLSFDGRRLYLNSKQEEVTVGIFDLAGREVAKVITGQVLSGSYAIYPGAYAHQMSTSALIIHASVGNEFSAYMFIPDGQTIHDKGLFQLTEKAIHKKTSGAILSSIDTLVITHNLFVEKIIPIDCHVCSFGDITVFEKVPSAPSDLTGESESSSTISLNWVDNSGNETGFRIEKASFQVMEWSDFSELTITDPDVTTYTDEDLIQGKNYKYRVLAFNSGGSSPYTEEITVTTQVANPLSISGPSSSTGDFDIVVSYSWPGIFASTSDRFELEESSSPTSGFTKIANSPWGSRPQSYTFNLSKPSGTYYYRARANAFGGFTDYTDVISVSVNTPVQTADLQVVNHTRYPMIDIRLNNQQTVGQGSWILQGNNYTFEFNSSGSVNYVLGVGFWDGSYRDVWFLLSGTTHVTMGTTTTLTFENPSIGQLLSGFAQYRDWTGEYWVDLVPYMATYRFFSNGTWILYNNGVQIDSGNIYLVSWPDNAFIVTFKLCPGCDEIILPHPFGQFQYKNGPPSWPIIEYTAQ